jgi:2-polyprenyl-6-methoxyphenol hydroxylase-like FAD-dependent oxidoreductase
LLTFKNGATAVADIVIGADGANSKIRPLITPLQPFYTGVTAIEGGVYDSATAVPAMHELLAGGKIFAFGDSKTLIVSSKGDGSLVFYTGSKTDENRATASGIDFGDREQVMTWFKKEFAGWGDVWVEMLEKVSLPLVVRPQYCMPLDQQWEAQHNITVLGDAAHLMPPYAGEGVNMAMLDALELCDCLTSGDYADARTAIATYEAEMCRRFAEIGQMTLEQMEWMHSENGLEGMLGMFEG